MDPIEARLTKKLDVLQSEVYRLENPTELPLSSPRAAALRSKITFIKSLLAAETGGAPPSGRLSNIAARVSALESILLTAAEAPKTADFSVKNVVLRKNLQEIESMAKQPFLSQTSSKIQNKISFTKSLPASEPQSNLLSLRAAAVEEVFGSHPSSSSASEKELGADEAVDLSSRKKIEKNNGDDYEEFQRKIGFLRSVLTEEMKWEGEDKVEELDGAVKSFSSLESEFSDLNDPIRGNDSSSSCSCTSSCFYGRGQIEEDTVEVENCVSELNEAEEVKMPENSDSVKASGVRVSAKQNGKLCAVGVLVGLFATAAAVAGVIFQSFYSEKEEMVYLVPT